MVRLTGLPPVVAVLLPEVALRWIKSEQRTGLLLPRWSPFITIWAPLLCAATGHLTECTELEQMLGDVLILPTPEAFDRLPTADHHRHRAIGGRFCVPGARSGAACRSVSVSAPVRRSAGRVGAAAHRHHPLDADTAVHGGISRHGGSATLRQSAKRAGAVVRTGAGSVGDRAGRKVHRGAARALCTAPHESLIRHRRR